MKIELVYTSRNEFLFLLIIEHRGESSELST